MTARERAVLRDRIARKLIEREEEDAAVIEAVDLREKAGRSALAALHEARRRAITPAERIAPAFMALAEPIVRDLDETLHQLSQLARKSDLAARIVAALPPLELCADDFDPVAHAREIIAVSERGMAAA